MEQEHDAHQRHDDELLDQLVREVVHRAVDERGAIVDGDDLHARRQALAQRGELGLDGLDRLQRVLAGAHHDHAAGHLALAVQLGDAAPHLGPELDGGDVAQPHGDARVARRERNLPEVVERLQVAAGAHHVLGLAQLQHRATGLLVGAFERRQHLGLRQVERAQPVRLQHDLELLDHAAHGRDFRHVRQRLQLEAQEPVLQRAQLGQIVAAALVDQRVFVDPADAGGIRTQRRLGGSRQAGLHLVQILQYPGARPVQVRPVFEQHVDERIPEERIAADRLGARHRQHRGSERVSDLVLDDLRRLAGEGRADDDLHVRQIGQRVERRAARRPHSPRRQQHRGQQHQEAVADGSEDEARDHGLPPAPFAAGSTDDRTAVPSLSR